MTETIDEKAAVEWCEATSARDSIDYYRSTSEMNAARAALKWRDERDEYKATSDRFEAESEQKGADLMACEAALEEATGIAVELESENKAMQARIAELEQKIKVSRMLNELAETQLAAAKATARAENAEAERDAAIKRAEEAEEAIYAYWLHPSYEWRKVSDLCNKIALRKETEARHE